MDEMLILLNILEKSNGKIKSCCIMRLEIH